MITEIICVGSDILLGNVINTNASYLAEKCVYLGLSNEYQGVSSNDKQRLASMLLTAKQRADIIFITGGMGPTKDDITKETISEVLEVKLVSDEAVDDAALEAGLSEINNKEAMILEGSHVLYNENSSTKGMILEKDDKIYVLLPGNPEEMRLMVEKQVVPYFMSKDTGAYYSRVIKMVGVTELDIAAKIKDLFELNNPQISTSEKPGEVHVRVTAKCDTEENAKNLVKPIIKHIKSLFPSNVYSSNEEETLEESVVRLLSSNGLTIATAESCTGGLVAATLIRVSGASDVFKEGFVTYSNRAKKTRIGVKKQTLEKFGAVSKETVTEMLTGTAKETKADVTVAISGVAGPSGGTEEKPVGTVYIGCYVKGNIRVERFQFKGDRNKVRATAASKALAMVRMCVKESLI